MRLVIETAGPACSVALFHDDRLVDFRHETVGRGHAERLLPMIASLPDGGRATAILVDCGPGSFTGVRVGIAAARALGLGWRAAVSGYSSLALLAARHFAQRLCETVTIAIPGGHGEMFVQRFASNPFAALCPAESRTPAAIVASDRVDADPAWLDARTTIRLDTGQRSLPPVPIYGRGADAKPAPSAGAGSHAEPAA